MESFLINGVPSREQPKNVFSILKIVKLNLPVKLQYPENDKLRNLLNSV